MKDSFPYCESRLTGFQLWSQDFVLVLVHQQYIPFIVSVKKLHFGAFFFLFSLDECFCFPVFCKSFSYLFVFYGIATIENKMFLVIAFCKLECL